MTRPCGSLSLNLNSWNIILAICSPCMVEREREEEGRWPLAVLLDRVYLATPSCHYGSRIHTCVRNTGSLSIQQCLGIFSKQKIVFGRFTFRATILFSSLCCLLIFVWPCLHRFTYSLIYVNVCVLLSARVLRSSQRCYSWASTVCHGWTSCLRPLNLSYRDLCHGEILGL